MIYFCNFKQFFDDLVTWKAFSIFKRYSLIFPTSKDQVLVYPYNFQMDFLIIYHCVKYFACFWSGFPTYVQRWTYGVKHTEWPIYAILNLPLLVLHFYTMRYVSISCLKIKWNYGFNFRIFLNWIITWIITIWQKKTIFNLSINQWTKKD